MQLQKKCELAPAILLCCVGILTSHVLSSYNPDIQWLGLTGEIKGLRTVRYLFGLYEIWEPRTYQVYCRIWTQASQTKSTVSCKRLAVLMVRNISAFPDIEMADCKKDIDLSQSLLWLNCLSRE